MHNLSDRKQAALQRVRIISHLLDNAIPIPGTGKRIGLDPLLGMIPGGGDILSSFLSVYIILESIRFGVSKETLTRMVSNVAWDAIAGTVPVAGDLFDAISKANARNVKLLEAHINHPEPRRAVDRLFAILVVLGLVAFLAIATAVTIYVVAQITQFLQTGLAQ